MSSRLTESAIQEFAIKLFERMRIDTALPMPATEEAISAVLQAWL